DEEKLQGTWTVVSMERRGKAAPADEVNAYKVIIKGDLFTVEDKREGKEEEQLKITLDPTKKPKAIDLIPQGRKKGRGTLKGIYELDGDTLKINVTKRENGERPTAFASGTDKDESLLVLKREKKDK